MNVLIRGMDYETRKELAECIARKTGFRYSAGYFSERPSSDAVFLCKGIPERVFYNGIPDCTAQEFRYEEILAIAKEAV